MAHFIGVNGVGSDIQVYDMDQSPPEYMGQYSVDIDGYNGFIYNEPNSGKPGVIMYCLQVSFIQKQSKNSNEKGSNLSLGTVSIHFQNQMLYACQLAKI